MAAEDLHQPAAVSLRRGPFWPWLAPLTRFEWSAAFFTLEKMAGGVATAAGQPEAIARPAIDHDVLDGTPLTIVSESTGPTWLDDSG